MAKLNTQQDALMERLVGTSNGKVIAALESMIAKPDFELRNHL